MTCNICGTPGRLTDDVAVQQWWWKDGAYKLGPTFGVADAYQLLRTTRPLMGVLAPVPCNFCKPEPPRVQQASIRDLLPPPPPPKPEIPTGQKYQEITDRVARRIAERQKRGGNGDSIMDRKVNEKTPANPEGQSSKQAASEFLGNRDLKVPGYVMGPEGVRRRFATQSNPAQPAPYRHESVDLCARMQVDQRVGGAAVGAYSGFQFGKKLCLAAAPFVPMPVCLATTTAVGIFAGAREGEHLANASPVCAEAREWKHQQQITKGDGK